MALIGGRAAALLPVSAVTSAQVTQAASGGTHDGCHSGSGRVWLVVWLGSIKARRRPSPWCAASCASKRMCVWRCTHSTTNCTKDRSRPRELRAQRRARPRRLHTLGVMCATRAVPADTRAWQRRHRTPLESTYCTPMPSSNIPRVDIPNGPTCTQMPVPCQQPRANNMSSRAPDPSNTTATILLPAIPTTLPPSRQPCTNKSRPANSMAADSPGF